MYSCLVCFFGDEVHAVFGEVGLTIGLGQVAIRIAKVV